MFLVNVNLKTGIVLPVFKSTECLTPADLAVKERAAYVRNAE